MTLLFAPPTVSVPIAGTLDQFPVRRVYCVGRNYVDHVREMKEGDERDDPFFFQKPADAVVGHGARVRRLRGGSDRSSRAARGAPPARLARPRPHRDLGDPRPARRGGLRVRL